MHNTPTQHNTRPGNLLVGCGVVLLVLILLIGFGAFFISANWRGWSATVTTKTFDAALTKAQIDPTEHAEIMVHVEGLMQRFEDKDITINQLGSVIEKLIESPVIPTAMVLGIDSLYIANSDLEETEKIQARIDLARYTQGLCTKSINESTVADVLAPVTAHTPDSDDIRINLTVGPNGQTKTITALKSADKVTTEQLQTLIATAKAKADEAGITETPDPIDLSDEIAKAIGIALGEITEEPTIDEVPADPTTDPAADPATNDGP